MPSRGAKKATMGMDEEDYEDEQVQSEEDENDEEWLPPVGRG